MTHRLFPNATLMCAGLCTMLVLSTPVALGQDNTALKDTAYCVGALRHSTTMHARLSPASYAKSGMQKLMQTTAIVGSAIEKHDIDTDTTRQLFAAGRADAQTCWDQVDMCFDSGAIDLELCMRPVKDACLKTTACDR